MTQSPSQNGTHKNATPTFMDTVGLECVVIRVTRPDTILVRTLMAPLQSYCSHYVVLAGVECNPDHGIQHVIDWLETHADFERFELRTYDWLRDSYGRLLGNLLDRQTGDSLTDYLLGLGVATAVPTHYADTITEMLTSQEPEL